MSQSCKWCFTAYHDTFGNEDELSLHAFFASLSSPEWGVYGGAQLERCPTTHKLHVQGFCVFSTNKKLPKPGKTSGIKLVHRFAHWEVMKGSLEDNEQYCSKTPGSRADWDAKGMREPDTLPRTWGERPVNNQGKRTDLEDACAALIAAEGDQEDRLRAIAFKHPTCIAKFSSGMKTLARLTEPDDYVVNEPDWRPWQMELKGKLMLPADDRSIMVYVDPKGGAGKSTVMRYFVTNKEHRACVLSGQIRDMSYAFCQKKYRIVFFDISRTSAEHVVHLLSFAETLKNGVIFSSKYESGMFAFRPPHVVFFSNEELPTVNGYYGGWTEDRLKLVRLSASSSGGGSGDAEPFYPGGSLFAPPAPSQSLFAPANAAYGQGLSVHATSSHNPFIDLTLSQHSMYDEE